MATPTPTGHKPAFLHTPPRDVAAWVAAFDVATLPILASSVATLEELSLNEDAVDAHMLAQALSDDPLFAIKVFAHLAQRRRGRDGGDAETLTQALVMLGITPFFRDFPAQSTVDEHLAEWPQALDGFNAVLARSHRAARFALAFAVQRMDRDNAVLYGAALLHDFAELLLWLRAPVLAIEIARRQRADSTLRSAAVQLQLLNVQLADLQHALMNEWHLPRVLIDFADAKREATSPQARNVHLAIRLARHTAAGWDNAALADDVRDIAALLHMAPDPTLALLQDIDEA
ncbi:MAG: HDOD domain-containing protein [Rubrivivax sp.]|nr:HDOD domain-containing protein [Rubrivivax sp.]